MINLTATTDKLSLITSSGADIDCLLSYVESALPITTSSDMTPGRKQTKVTTATTTDISGSPAASSVRNVKEFSLRNIDASVSNDTTVQFDLNGTLSTMFECTLLAQEELIYKDGIFYHFDSNGALYSVGLPYAVQADMETGTSTTLVVTPGMQHFHPGHPKCWGKTTVSGGTPTLQVSYNVTSITDTATDQLTVTIATDFSGAHYACNVSIEAATTSLSATTTSLAAFIRNATLAAGSFIIQACEFDIGAATDPSSWHWICCGDL